MKTFENKIESTLAGYNAVTLYEMVLKSKTQMPSLTHALDKALTEKIDHMTESEFTHFCQQTSEINPSPTTTPPPMESPVKFKYSRAESNGGGEFSFEELLNRANQAESDLAHQTKIYKFMRRYFVNVMLFCLAFGSILGVGVMAFLWSMSG